MKNILILEDHEDCITLFKDMLSKQDYGLTILRSLSELEALGPSLSVGGFDLMLADIKLPDGFFLDWITQKKSALMENVPTIIISSVDDLEVLRTSFEWGATDYLIKPVKRNELLIKMERATRDYRIKSTANAQEVLDELTSIEAKIFQLFLNNPHSALSRERIMREVWKKVVVNPKTLDVHLSNLRKKLSSSQWSIEADPDKGWKLSKHS